MTSEYTVSERLLTRDDFRDACLERDFRRVFALMKQWDGVSQDRIAASVEGLTQSRVSRIMRGHEQVTTLKVLEKISDALHIPGDYLGLASRDWEINPTPVPTSAPQASPTPTPSAAATSVGDLCDRNYTLDIEIDEQGWSTLTYRHELDNGTDTPFTSMSRELWFEHTDGPLKLEPLDPEDQDRNVMIERQHETATSIQFACRLFPALPPGESAVVGFRCQGGQFVSDHYWRQKFNRPTDRFTIRLRHAGVRSLSACSAVEERPDGSEVSATESLTWRRDEDGVMVELVRTDLKPNQSVTLRWDQFRG